MMNDSNPFNPDQWLEAQRKYWDAWLDLSRMSTEAASASPGAAPAANPWAGALEQWWKSVSAAVPPEGRDFFDRMMDLGRGYFTMAEGLVRQGGGAAPAEALKTWLDQLSESLRTAGRGKGAADNHARDFMAFWQLPMDTWQRVASSFMPLPGDIMTALRPEGAPALGRDMREHLDRFLSIPGVGYTRESQEQYQDLSRLLLEYQCAWQAYEAGLARVALESVDRFRARLADAARREQPIGTMRELFNEWVDVCEEVYGEYVMSEDYARAYGEMVNALMAVKHQGSKLVDEVLEGLNMPTRREISTLHERFQESRREIRRLRRDLDELLAVRNGNAAGAPAATGQETPARRPARRAAAKPKSATPGPASPKSAKSAKSAKKRT
jgi:polyhydroxyalkanoate synthase subunit PhaE